MWSGEFLGWLHTCSGLLAAMAGAMHELAEQISSAPVSRVTLQAVCALLQNPIWEDPEYSWCATVVHARLVSALPSNCPCVLQECPGR